MSPLTPIGAGGTAPSPAPARPQSLMLDLSQPLSASQARNQAFLQRLCIIISLAVLALVAWSGFATVHEVSVARGSIVPAQLERVVQHFEGGVVRQILVQPGDRVSAGSALFVLEDATTYEDLALAQRRRADLEARIESLLALSEDRPADFSRFDDEIAEDAAATHRTKRDALIAQHQLLESQIAQAQHLDATYDAQLESLEDDRIFAEQNFARIESLVDKGYATRALLAERRKAITDALNQIVVAREKKKAAAEQLAEAEKQLTAFHADTHSQWAESLQALRTELVALIGDVSRSTRRQGRLTVTSPVAGRVKSLAVTSAGDIAQPGETLATIVPINQALLADTKVPVSEIGYIDVGAPVHVKVSAFDFTRFGWIDGTVTRISPSAFIEDGEDAYYQVIISLAANHLPGIPTAKLVPGMSVEGDIITGDKSVLAYLLVPLRKALKSSFMER
ncbi:HlyD family type I secretion periplasmic adaptor subunit [Acuticoccus sp. I52.16.1]|uniref:HlyD family type I secretion periplasmic adaptor subunit n=1 Tax=Acuticoccus sp. I52.16.1 TaxID=2928472 RepID=UPI001FD2A3BC|nr:HlyD family type I secretion periplasmic adaptor subunit [Acuticoccus sp. I52.16.1]UOM34105.1 HlyD family type I secretion periplasmic adaptor subunit [Acuticoccus sp. I52.16.1]